MTSPRILVAGIGNIFMGDDAFGVEVAQRLSRRPLPGGVRVVDFGIRGIDLTYALMDGYDAVILVDAMPHGQPPGTISLIEPARDGPEDETITGVPLIDTHNLEPAKVLQLAAALGARIEQLLVVGCEPLTVGSDDEMPAGLSEPVQAAVDQAIDLIELIIGKVISSKRAVHLRDTTPFEPASMRNL